MNTDNFNEDTLSMADVLREMDIEFLVSGEYGITVDEAAKFISNKHFIFLDVRTKEENDHLTFSFSTFRQGVPFLSDSEGGGGIGILIDGCLISVY